MQVLHLHWNRWVTALIALPRQPEASDISRVTCAHELIVAIEREQFTTEWLAEQTDDVFHTAMAIVEGVAHPSSLLETAHQALAEEEERWGNRLLRLQPVIDPAVAEVFL